ncbi:MAG: hypothetical protein J7604_24705 [Sporocytophaga sp.]|uniref:hypothetical protein n=1 Tax=Sporocytophaga sp. TaxID=2231183 RepID=UPI001B2686D0|nr:hypothetical protein [Sporocytophaga sp.]MBO9703433.1 hypothetical protein [Sporocytophaga sp.]
MKKVVLKFTFILLLVTVFFSCKKKEKEVAPQFGSNGTYVLLTAMGMWDAGFYTAFDGMPSGDISYVSNKSLQITSVFGVRSYKNWFFDRTNAAGEAGLQKYTVSSDGSIVNSGFIIKSTQYTIVDENTGFYLDEDRGLLKLQKFNPSTMQRTGELDFSSLAKTGVEYQVLGKHILAAKEGKLYASITYGTTAAQGFGDDLYSEIEFAVIDIATGTLDKTIKYDGLKGIGWGSSANRFLTKGDDGALYFYSSGFSSGIQNSSIIRIKAGETDFDKTWIIRASDYATQSTFATALVKGGKLYTQVSATPISDFSKLGAYSFDYYAIDINTKAGAKIEGIPTCHYAWANEQAITEIDGKIYFWAQTPTSKGYYVLDGDKGIKAFNVTDGGFIWGFVKLEE